MIPVIGDRDAEDMRPEWIEDPAVDAEFPDQGVAVFRRQLHHAADIIVDDPHFHAFADFPLEYLQDVVPHVAVFDDEIFHEDELLGFVQFFQQPFKELFPGAEVFGLGIFIHREHGCRDMVVRAGTPVGRAQIVDLVVDARVHGLQFLQHVRVLFQKAGGLLADADVLGLDVLPDPVASEDQVEQPAENREDQDWDDPGQLVGRILFFIDDEEHDDDTEDGKCPVHVSIFVCQQEDPRHHYHQLEEDQQGGNDQPVRHEFDDSFHNNPYDPLILSVFWIYNESYYNNIPHYSRKERRLE